MIARPARFTSGFVVVGIAALAMVVASGAFITFFFISRGFTTRIDEEARAAPDVYALYRAREADPIHTAVESVRNLTRPEIRVRFFARDQRFIVEPDGHVFHPPPPPPDAFRPRPEGDGRGMPPPLEGRPGPRFGPPRDRAPRGRNGGFLSDVLHIGARRVGVEDGFFFIEPDAAVLASQVRIAAMATLAAALAVIALLLALGRSVRREALRPLLETTAALDRLAARDFTPYVVRTDQRDAIGALARSYTAASATVAAAFEERRLAQAEMQRFVADAGHELRTPLTVVTGYLDVLEGGALADPVLVQRIFATLRAESRRMRGLIDKLIVLARLEQFDGERTATLDACAVTSRVVHTFAPLAPNGAIPLDAPEHAYIIARESEIFEALANVVENALKHAEGAAIDITVAADPREVSIAVRDLGPGMNPDERRQAFDRFYRGERRGETPGSGLGLAIVKRTVERAAGTIDLRTSEGAGTVVTLRFPRAHDPEAAPPLK